MEINFRRINVISAELMATLLIHIGEITVRFPCNHADSLTFAYRDCVFALALFEIVYSFVKREICVLFWLVFALSFLFPVIEDYFNIMIPYETWISRGMPDFGTLSH